MVSGEKSLSVIIPARNEEYLERTMRDVLSNARGNTEVIAILDGYLPDPPIEIGDERAIFLHYEQSIGQRQAINAAAQHSQAEYIMKLDAHCAVDEGFDVKLMEEHEYDWTVIPRMYNLDYKTWLPKKHKKTDYMYITSKNEITKKFFRAQYYVNYKGPNGERLRQPKSDKMIDDTMCCMGPCFFMNRTRFWELGGCDEAHGGWGQQGIEVALKAWLSGGALKVNKNTWFAHWFRGGGGPGFPYKMSGRDQQKARKYSQSLWLKDRWPLATRKFQWVLDKFDPPGWN
jgi:hypothetical protein